MELAFNMALGQGGIGVVVRNNAGQCVAALARHFPYASSALHMEAEACRVIIVKTVIILIFTLSS